MDSLPTRSLIDVESNDLRVECTVNPSNEIRQLVQFRIQPTVARFFSIVQQQTLTFSVLLGSRCNSAIEYDDE